MASNVPDQYAHLETLPVSALEKEIAKYQAVDGNSLSDEELEKVCAIHTIMRRKTSGPPKPKSSGKRELSLEELGALL